MTEDRPQPAKPTMCLLDHRHTIVCAPIIRGETEWRTSGVPGLFPVGWWRFWRRWVW